MRVIQCVRSLAKTYGLGIYAIMLPSRGFLVAHSTKDQFNLAPPLSLKGMSKIIVCFQFSFPNRYKKTTYACLL